MATLSEDIPNARALVIEGNPGMRSRLATQLRNLEYQSFEFVLCEQHFYDENASDQDLLDDLRRNQLLPYSTLFVMITGEATYSRVVAVLTLMQRNTPCC